LKEGGHDAVREHPLGGAREYWLRGESVRQVIDAIPTLAGHRLGEKNAIRSETRELK